MTARGYRRFSGCRLPLVGGYRQSPRTIIRTAASCRYSGNLTVDGLGTKWTGPPFCSGSQSLQTRRIKSGQIADCELQARFVHFSGPLTIQLRKSGLTIDCSLRLILICPYIETLFF
jgi:hypothetical protein